MPFVDAFFNFTTYVVLCIVEFTDAFAQATHQLRNLAATEKKNYQ